MFKPNRESQFLHESSTLSRDSLFLYAFSLVSVLEHARSRTFTHTISCTCVFDAIYTLKFKSNRTYTRESLFLYESSVVSVLDSMNINVWLLFSRIRSDIRTNHKWLILTPISISTRRRPVFNKLRHVNQVVNPDSRATFTWLVFNKLTHVDPGRYLVCLPLSLSTSSFHRSVYLHCDTEPRCDLSVRRAQSPIIAPHILATSSSAAVSTAVQHTARATAIMTAALSEHWYTSHGLLYTTNVWNVVCTMRFTRDPVSMTDHDTLNQCCFNVGPASQTVDQR